MAACSCLKFEQVMSRFSCSASGFDVIALQA